MKLKLLDTGYVSPTTALVNQTQISDANRAGYTGAAVSSITLDVESITRNRQINTENKSTPDTLTDSNTSLVSVGNRVFNITAIALKTITTSSWSKSKEYQLARMEKTKGIKLLYPSENSSQLPTWIEVEGAENTGGTFSDASPTDDAGTIGATIPYLPGYVKNFSVSDAPNGNYWRITFTFEVTG